MTGATAQACHADSNTSDGYLLGDGSQVTACSARHNGGVGFYMPSEAAAVDCLAHTNTSNGFQLGERARVTRCTAMKNGGDGFVVGGSVAGAEVSGCTEMSNTGRGIQQQSPSLIAQNRASGNTAGNYLLGMTGAFPVSSAGAGVGPWDNLQY